MWGVGEWDARRTGGGEREVGAHVSLSTRRPQWSDSSTLGTIMGFEQSHDPKSWLELSTCTAQI
jgi:hypothetical protein